MLRESALDDQMKRLIDTFYNVVNRAYGFRPESKIDHKQFGIDADEKTLLWTPDDKKIYCDEGRSPILGVINIGLNIQAGGTDAEFAGAHQ